MNVLLVNILVKLLRNLLVKILRLHHRHSTIKCKSTVHLRFLFGIIYKKLMIKQVIPFRSIIFFICSHCFDQFLYFLSYYKTVITNVNHLHFCMEILLSGYHVFEWIFAVNHPVIHHS